MELAPVSPPSPGRLGRLRDGTLVRIRSAGPADRGRVTEFLRHVTRDSLELRFLSAARPETALSEILSSGAPPDRVSLLLEIPDPDHPRVIAHGEYVRARQDRTRAEVAFLVSDERQGQGAATLLLLHLARQARSAGIRQFDAVTLPENRAMHDVFVGIGFPCSSTLREGLEYVALDIRRDPETGIVPVTSPGNRPRLRA
jgi:acetate---CoA ligase (ADP-forming)